MVRLPLENSRDWIGRTPIRKTSSVRWLFLLPGGEGQDAGESHLSTVGMHAVHKRWLFNPLRLRSINDSTQGRPSRNRANLGLNDAIPLGLKDGTLTGHIFYHEEEPPT
jgi:hypothetical protein